MCSVLQFRCVVHRIVAKKLCRIMRSNLGNVTFWPPGPDVPASGSHLLLGSKNRKFITRLCGSGVVSMLFFVKNYMGYWGRSWYHGLNGELCPEHFRKGPLIFFSPPFWLGLLDFKSNPVLLLPPSSSSHFYISSIWMTHTPPPPPPAVQPQDPYFYSSYFYISSSWMTHTPPPPPQKNQKSKTQKN